MLETFGYEQVTQIKMSRYSDFRPATYVNAYLVEGLLIDSGPAHTAEELADFLKGETITTVVNTHYHEDHIAANALLKERYGVELFAHRLAVDRINQRPVLYPYQEEVWGYPVPCQVQEIGDTILTEQFRFEVLATPGHSPDHICLFERDLGWLFTGDLFFSTHPGVARPEENQWYIIDSLKKINKLKPRVLFTAPADIVSQPEEALEETIRYLEVTGRRVTELLKRGLSPAEIRQEIFGDESPLAEATQEQFSSLNLVKGYCQEYLI